jgi:hypothetical protein
MATKEEKQTAKDLKAQEERDARELKETQERAAKAAEKGKSSKSPSTIKDYLSGLQSRVEENNNVIASALVAIDGILKAVDDGIESENIKSFAVISEYLHNNDTKLADAVAHNTPVGEVRVKSS